MTALKLPGLTAGFLKDKKKLAVFFFFFSYFVIDLAILRDYGSAWDDIPLRNNAIYEMNLFITNKLWNYINTFQALLVGLEYGLNLKDPQKMLLIRHTAIFLLFFASSVVFYLLCARHFKNRLFGLLGAVFLVVCPRIFAASFYNPKDIPFLSFFIFAVYTLILYLDRKTFPLMVAHVLTTVILINMHLSGAFILLLTLIFMCRDLRRKSTTFSEAGLFLAYLLLVSFITAFFCPYIFKNPAALFSNQVHAQLTVAGAEHFIYNDAMLFLGKHLDPSITPWNYNLVWMAVTIPVAYLVLFVIGLFFLFRDIILSPRQFFMNRTEDIIFLSWFFVPLIVPVILRSALYDGWRHHFFIYPAFILIALTGVKGLLEFVSSRPSGAQRSSALNFLVFIIALSIAVSLSAMMRYHPYQNVYFNCLIGGIKGAEQKFDLDYWGLSYTKGFEFIAADNAEPHVVVGVENYAARSAHYLLQKKDRKRLFLVNMPPDKEYILYNGKHVYPTKAKYYITNHRWQKEEDKHYQKAFSVAVDGVSIMTVYYL